MYTRTSPAGRSATYHRGTQLRVYRVVLIRSYQHHSRFKRELLYDMEAAPFALTLRMLKAEVMETLLYGCVRWTLGKEHFDELQTAHHRFLLRIVGFQRRQRTDHLMSYAMAQCESVETTICKRGASDGAPGAGNGTGTYPYQHRPLAGALARQF